MQKKVIETWDDTVLLCEKDRVTGQGAETQEEALEAMAREEENDVESAPTVHAPTRPSSSTIFAPEEQQKKHRKDPLANAISEVAMSVEEEYFENKKKQEKP